MGFLLMEMAVLFSVHAGRWMRFAAPLLAQAKIQQISTGITKAGR